MHKSGEHDFWTCTGDLVKKDPLPVLVPKKEPAMMHPWLLQDEKKRLATGRLHITQIAHIEDHGCLIVARKRRVPLWHLPLGH
jgi:hypothetical protein